MHGFPRYRLLQEDAKPLQREHVLDVHDAQLLQDLHVRTTTLERALPFSSTLGITATSHPRAHAITRGQCTSFLSFCIHRERNKGIELDAK